MSDVIHLHTHTIETQLRSFMFTTTALAKDPEDFGNLVKKVDEFITAQRTCATSLTNFQAVPQQSPRLALFKFLSNSFKTFLKAIKDLDNRVVKIEYLPTQTSVTSGDDLFTCKLIAENVKTMNMNATAEALSKIFRLNVIYQPGVVTCIKSLIARYNSELAGAFEARAKSAPPKSRPVEDDWKDQGRVRQPSASLK